MAYQIGWFSTGRDQAAIDLFDTIYRAIKDGIIKAEIAFVFSNRVRGEAEESDRFFDVVEGYGIPLIHFSSKNFQPFDGVYPEQSRGTQDKPFDRIAFDREVMKRLASFHPDLVVLAGYMLIVGEEMCQKYKMINLHPALPGGPVGTWQEVILKLIKEDASKTGAMMHLVTPILDKGPPISYYSFSLKGGKFDALWQVEDKGRLFDEIRSEGVRRELPLIFFTIKEFADGTLTIDGETVYANGKPLKVGYDLTREIEEWLTSS